MQLIVPPGTRIVAEHEVLVGETGLTMPGGAVGVIVRAPSDGTHAYRIRFPDGGEASLRRPQFRILKTVRESGLGEGIPVDVDWMKFVIYRCVVGSRAFGLDTQESDVDRRGIYLPPAVLQWSLFGVPEQLENEETQEADWELSKFLRLALKANPGILECMYTPLVEDATDLAQELLTIRGAFLSKLVQAERLRPRAALLAAGARDDPGTRGASFVSARMHHTTARPALRRLRGEPVAALPEGKPAARKTAPLRVPCDPHRHSSPPDRRLKQTSSA